MTRWLISLPAWGERCVEECCAAVLPALRRAVAELGDLDVRVIVHTDAPERMAGEWGPNMHCRPVPAGARYFDCMSQAHREVLASALAGDIVVFLTAGAVLSDGALAYCLDRFTENARLRAVLCAVPRVLAEGPLPDSGAARDLARWGWEHRHPLTQDCTWPDGRSRDLSRTYYERDGGVVTRVCLPHPLAVRVDGRRLNFTPTVDANLIQCFDRTEMHLVPDSRRLAAVKLTPADKGHDLAPGTMRERLAAYEIVIPDPLQRWFLSQPVALVGPPRDCGDVEVVDKIMRASGGKP